MTQTTFVLQSHYVQTPFAQESVHRVVLTHAGVSAAVQEEIQVAMQEASIVVVVSGVVVVVVVVVAASAA